MGGTLRVLALHLRLPCCCRPSGRLDGDRPAIVGVRVDWGTLVAGAATPALAVGTTLLKTLPEVGCAAEGGRVSRVAGGARDGEFVSGAGEVDSADEGVALVGDDEEGELGVS